MDYSSMAKTISYTASPTGKLFHADEKFVRTIIGPIGSGKSVACCIEIFKKACEQVPGTDGVRRTRWAIIRNTYRELIDTTMRTFFDWIPESLGTLRKIDMEFTMKFALPDNTIVESEVLFRALDKPQDIKKLLSLELTGAWLNECREIPKQVLDMSQGRVGRYPNKRQGGPTWWGIIADTNPPDSDHWYYNLFEERLPENHSIYHQPSGLSDKAENIDNLPPNYYKNMMAGKDQEWINVYVHGQYGFITDGRPIFPEYKEHLHYNSSLLAPPPGAKIYVGVDFGLTPAAAIGYITAMGAMRVIDELTTFDMGAVSFGRVLKHKLNTEYPDHEFEVYGDPAGEQRAQTDEQTPFMILSQQGIDAWPTYTNDFTIRREIIAENMLRLDMAGDPAFQIGPKARMLRKAFAGGYKYKRLQVSGEERFQDKPDKNRYSHIADACQYLTLGALGSDRVIGGYGDQKIDYKNINRLIV
jgi:hypothetical protein